MRRPAGPLLWAVALGALGAGGVALDARGWSPGTRAKRAAAVVAGPEAPPRVPFPAAVATRAARGPVALFYFSPTCPHCQHVAAEVQALSERLAARGATVLGVASRSALEADLALFRSRYAATFEILTDSTGEIAVAMGARSTPSVMLVAAAPGAEPRPDGAVALQVLDLWYPYSPGFDALVEGRVAGDPFTAYRADEYQGTNACGACHEEEEASWDLTFHAVAWRTLERGGQDRDPACVRCHVVGAGRPTGHGSGAPTDLVDVGCEACHGPGGPHDPGGAPPEDPRGVCVGCHDAGHSIDFTLAKALPGIDHFRAPNLPDREREERLRQLWGGEAPRTLLAFREGDNVGSARCQACHPAEYDQWATSRHAAAMSSLRPKGADDPACVRCHATADRATAAPPAAPTLRDFDVLGGVGCESCHGPGADHVAAGGGKDNVLGLGESCPVCVIEALCTACHTPKWSPAWSLDAALPHVSHAGAAPP